MADLKVGTAVDRKDLSSVLTIFRLKPENGSRFPDYLPGQYIALRRDNCRLTKKQVEPDGSVRYVPDIDASGQQKIGPVTHSYSISSAPFESQEHGCLEFYVVLEKSGDGTLGRLSTSFFEMATPSNDRITYVNRITGNFTLPKTAEGFKSVLLVGTGTGLAPFVSMIKQIDYEARQGKVDSVQYTLLHTNRTFEELAYHQELLDIEAARRFDFVYVPSVSRPTERDVKDPGMGQGRANNLLRHMFGMDVKEGGGRVVAPKLPSTISQASLMKRLDPPSTVLLTCGNPESMEDIKFVADTHHIKFEKEDW
jgi:ferredoxin-NADP reductase